MPRSAPVVRLTAAGLVLEGDVPCLPSVLQGLKKRLLALRLQELLLLIIEIL